MSHAAPTGPSGVQARKPGAGGYRIVRLANGSHSIHSLAEAETFHPVVGPVAEAEALYVRQLNLVERLCEAARAGEKLVVWDVGLGAAANPITFLRAATGVSGRIRIESFDHTLEPLRFALANREHLPYLAGYEDTLATLLDQGCAEIRSDAQTATWVMHTGDFPAFTRSPATALLPKPHAIMFDAFSPATNPAMWTLPLFADMFRLLDPDRPCALPTYSRSTMLRVTLLLAGFFVGIGHATGEKEETTVAANSPTLIREPLDGRWLQRARRSTSAEPLVTAEYRQAPLREETWLRLAAHPQFSH